MTADLKRIEDLLQQLGDSLSRDSKSTTAQHLWSLRQRILNGTETKAVLAEIAQLAPLAQYADFTNQQEHLLSMIQELAEATRQGM